MKIRSLVAAAAAMSERIFTEKLLPLPTPLRYPDVSRLMRAHTGTTGFDVDDPCGQLRVEVPQASLKSGNQCKCELSRVQARRLVTTR